MDGFEESRYRYIRDDLDPDVKLSRTASLPSAYRSPRFRHGPTLQTQDLPVNDQITYSAIERPSASFSPFQSEDQTSPGSSTALQQLSNVCPHSGTCSVKCSYRYDKSSPRTDEAVNQTHRRNGSGSLSSHSPNSTVSFTFKQDDHPLSESGLLRRHQSLTLHRPRDSISSLSSSPGKGVHELIEGNRRRSRTSSDMLLQAGNASTPGSGSSGASPSMHSPIDGIGRTPWSPTPEDHAILGTPHSRRSAASSAQEGLGITAFNRSGNASPAVEEVTISFENATLAQHSNPPTSAGKPQPPKRGTPSLSLITSFEDLPGTAAKSAGASPIEQHVAGSQNPRFQGPFSAAAYVRPIGHSFTNAAQPKKSDAFSSPINDPKVAYTAAPGAGRDIWSRQKAAVAGRSRPEASNTLEEESEKFGSPTTSVAPSQPYQSNHFFAQQQQQQQTPQQTSFTRSGAPSGLFPAAQIQSQMNGWPLQNGLPPLAPSWALPQNTMPSTLQMSPSPLLQQNMLNGYHKSAIPTQIPSFGMPQVPSPAFPPQMSLDIERMAAEKGYNPPQFNCNPRKARFCVIKSYTEDDVHKSIKYDIWSSTKLGNQRLDRIYRQSAEEGPLYLFFSVNGSGHFCGIAEMLSAVDDTVDSNVWSDSKWKGIFKLRWWFIKDVPNGVLRHLRLHNTQEKKPVTSSRDTQEVPYDVGLEMLNIVAAYPSKTSLLQDFAHYEAQDARRNNFQPDQILVPAMSNQPQPQQHQGNQPNRMRRQVAQAF